ncbi:MAG: hypothetical protein K2X61_08145 [Caulobacteraceae bacterium]|nr:hypothetical protein [Caulobacteraceae bacterium]
MASRPQPVRPNDQPPSGGLDPALLRLIEAMARADARRDLEAARRLPPATT